MDNIRWAPELCIYRERQCAALVALGPVVRPRQEGDPPDWPDLMIISRQDIVDALRPEWLALHHQAIMAMAIEERPT